MVEGETRLRIYKTFYQLLFPNINWFKSFHDQTKTSKSKSHKLTKTTPHSSIISWSQIGKFITSGEIWEWFTELSFVKLDICGVLRMQARVIGEGNELCWYEVNTYWMWSVIHRFDLSVVMMIGEEVTNGMKVLIWRGKRGTSALNRLTSYTVQIKKGRIC